MELSLKTICFMLGYLTLCSFQRSNASSSLEDQKCGNEKFYCPKNGQCYDRNLRCTSAMVCLDLDSKGNEAKCYPSGTSGMYNYYKKESKIRSSSSSRKKRSIFSMTRHWFVQYRGFVYEFGEAGYQELDMNDPNYKYGPGREKVFDEDLVGVSSCSRDQVTGFIKKWLEANPNYKTFANNCQDFAKALLRELGNNCPNRKRRQDEGKESLKAQCPINSAALSSISFFNWKLNALFGPLIAVAIFYIE